MKKETRHGNSSVRRGSLALAALIAVVLAVAIDSCRSKPVIRGTEGAPPEAGPRATLVTAKALPAAQDLYAYLLSMRGKGILSGQQSDRSQKEIAAVKEATGKFPAICGFDLIDYSPSRVERGARSAETGAAIKWWKEGGIVSLCWHWNAPKGLIDQAPDKLWWSGFYTKATTFDFSIALEDPQGADYALLIRDIDVIAAELKKLESAGLPVLWRPLHEASGGWFWWGARGPEAYIALYRLMFDRLVNYHGLANLIWVWNGQDGEWYPGDDVVDIVSEDIYPKPRDYSSQELKYALALEYPGAPKLIALSENGVVPDPSKLASEEVAWSWFCTWSGDFVMDPATRKYWDKQTEASALKRFYENPYVITRDRVPALGRPR